MNPIQNAIEKGREDFEKTMLITKAGSWLECSDYEGTVKDIQSHISSLLHSVLEAIEGEIGEGKMKAEGIKIGTGIIKGSDIESGVVIGINQERSRLLSLIKQAKEV